MIKNYIYPCPLTQMNPTVSKVYYRYWTTFHHISIWTHPRSIYITHSSMWNRIRTSFNFFWPNSTKPRKWNKYMKLANPNITQLQFQLFLILYHNKANKSKTFAYHWIIFKLCRHQKQTYIFLHIVHNFLESISEGKFVKINEMDTLSTFHVPFLALLFPIFRSQLSFHVMRSFQRL